MATLAVLNGGEAAPVIKRCSCGRQYTRGTWRMLQFKGVQDIGDGTRLEMRNCLCRSTIAIDLPPTLQVVTASDRARGVASAYDYLAAHRAYRRRVLRAALAIVGFVTSAVALVRLLNAHVGR